MKVELHRFELPLEHEFRIARGSTSVQQSIVVELHKDGVSGFGEVTENTFYGHSLASISRSIMELTPILESWDGNHPSELWELLREKSDDFFAISAIDAAAYDLLGKIAGKQTFELLGTPWKNIPDSSYTIGIDSVETMKSKLLQNPNWKNYKIKLGSENDVEIVKGLREVTDAIFRVDANCGWGVEEAIRNSFQLKELGVQFIEQPLPRDAEPAAKAEVFAKSALPVIADEDCLKEQDVEECEKFFHGINVKLCKCGGLTPAVRMLQKARSKGMKTMVGCMVESSVGISAAAQLSPLLDFADLDGAVLLSEDVADGVLIDDGKICLADGYGSGISLL